MLTYTCRVEEVAKMFVFTAVSRLFLKILFVPRSNHSPSRLQNQVYQNIIAVYSDNYTTQINVNGEQDVEFI